MSGAGWADWFNIDNSDLEPFERLLHKENMIDDLMKSYSDESILEYRTKLLSIFEEALDDVNGALSIQYEATDRFFSLNDIKILIDSIPILPEQAPQSPQE